MKRLDDIYRDSPDAAAFSRAYLDVLADTLRRLDAAAVARFIEMLLEARERGARIFFIGNGGSAATASHFANDLAIGTRSPHKPFRAVSLTDNAAVITAIANDDGYDEIFVQQLQNQMARGDVVVAISASGNSPNIIKAVGYANANGAHTIGLSGFDGGRLRQVAGHCVHVPTPVGDYGPVEDAHMILDHLVGAYLVRHVRAAAMAGVAT